MPPFLGELGNSRIHRQRDKLLMPKGKDRSKFKKETYCRLENYTDLKSIIMARAIESKQRMRKAVPGRNWRVNKEALP